MSRPVTPLTAQEEAQVRAKHGGPHWIPGRPFCEPCRLLATLDEERSRAGGDLRPFESFVVLRGPEEVAEFEQQRREWASLLRVILERVDPTEPTP